MIIVINNYDSFVHNLARYITLLGRECQTIRNDTMKPEEIAKLHPEAILLSPGPSIAKKAGNSIQLVQALGDKVPILGVCLGHLAIAEAYGGKTGKAKQPAHGMAFEMRHEQEGIFCGLPTPLMGGLYHSLAVLETGEKLEAKAWRDNGEIMAVKHKQYNIWGVQFHPESILTPQGMKLIANFLEDKPT